MLTFQDEKVKNLPSCAVNGGDLWRLNRFRSPGPAGRAHNTLPDSPPRFTRLTIGIARIYDWGPVSGFSTANRNLFVLVL